VRFTFNLRQSLEWINSIEEWLQGLALQYGYLGIFVVSFIGASSIVFPIPYTILIIYFGSQWDPLIVALSGGAGSAVGEFFGYVLGYYGRTIVNEKNQKKMNYILKIFSRYGAFTIFLFALTPLPDDLLFIPLGIMRYSFLKAFIPSLLGKVLMCLILAYGGYYSIGFIEEVLGEAGSIYTTLATAILLLIVIVAMFKIDWEKFFPLEENEKKP
jgi:membrane protein YqaA with SNARE-associated domain